MSQKCAFKCAVMYLIIFILVLIKIELTNNVKSTRSEVNEFFVEHPDLIIERVNYEFPQVKVRTITHSGRTYDVFYDYSMDPFFVSRVR